MHRPDVVVELAQDARYLVVLEEALARVVDCDRGEGRHGSDAAAEGSQSKRPAQDRELVADGGRRGALEAPALRVAGDPLRGDVLGPLAAERTLEALPGLARPAQGAPAREPVLSGQQVEQALEGDDAPRRGRQGRLGLPFGQQPDRVVTVARA